MYFKHGKGSECEERKDDECGEPNSDIDLAQLEELNLTSMVTEGRKTLFCGKKSQNENDVDTFG